MISVIIPTYNRKRLLVQALKSLTIHNYKDKFEVIVVDDGSSQDFEKAVKNFQNKLDIKFFKEKRAGVCRARNVGIKNAKGEILAFFDDDALVDESWLKSINQAMGNANVVVGRGLFKTKNMWQYFAPHYDKGEKRRMLTEGIWECNFAAKKIVFDQVGGFDEKIGWGYEGNELAERIRRAGYEIAYEPSMIIYHDYATGFKNYFIKQFKFGQKSAYLRKQGINVGKMNAGTSNKKLEKLVWHKKLFIKVIAKIGSWFHKIGEAIS